jgi:tetraacyldisaccharide-1-P 4'-kinase
VSDVSVALDETAREVSERQVLPAGGLRERFGQQRPITALRGTYSFFAKPTQFLRKTASAHERPAWRAGSRFVAGPLASGSRRGR